MNSISTKLLPPTGRMFEQERVQASESAPVEISVVRTAIATVTSSSFMRQAMRAIIDPFCNALAHGIGKLLKKDWPTHDDGICDSM